nr:nucleotidyl transferase AbiEii/AbiGii toxin family protein [Kibdelosporangium sp. MJ126-NF4]CEL14941.1 hypothetical protein [Kibdelosporangium sp. MJ126-NF4]CTQ93465.1 hypothetical protein [Kibdelosporangium sp. MJ126-NF4]
MTRPTKTNAAGRAYLDLQNRARREKRATQELLTLYVLERWLARLSASAYVEMFVLKGGMLLAVFDCRRPTADVDLLAQRLANDEATVTDRVLAIARIHLDDGVDYLVDTVTAQSIRDQDDYSGIRISMDCRISTAMVKLKLDVNVGDPVTPAPRQVELPSQRPGQPAVSILGYPIETVLAEKTTTAIALGEANTRVRDYADIYTLTCRYRVSSDMMRAALRATAGHRGVVLAPLSEVVGDLARQRQATYKAFRNRLGEDGARLRTEFIDVVTVVVGFVDPLVAGSGDMTWDPQARRWTT